MKRAPESTLTGTTAPTTGTTAHRNYRPSTAQAPVKSAPLPVWSSFPPEIGRYYRLAVLPLVRPPSGNTTHITSTTAYSAGNVHLLPVWACILPLRPNYYI